MIDWWGLFGTLGMAAFLLFGGIIILWDRWRARRARRALKDGPEDEPYRIFTRAHDLQLAAREIPERLQRASPDSFKGWSDRDGSGWQRQCGLIERFDGLQKPLHLLVDMLREAIGTRLAQNVTITFLVDQSGSMRGPPIAAVASALRALVDALDILGVRAGILGFSTAGWHGGFARRDWLHQGRPSRPGRLCALLHIVYKDAGDARWEEQSRLAFVHPDVLRENVDGEALEWAAERLRGSSPGKKLLIILSDGAPVDDSTLQQNGERYLSRELKRTVTRLEQAGDILLGAIDLSGENWAADYYPRVLETSLEEIVDRTVELIALLWRQTDQANQP